MIPKQIHYCWFGKKRKPKLVLDCIESWRRILPDYEIIEWNENNFKLENTFAKNFYQLKKFAFVSDYARLKILYDHGGIYLDTDMLLLKKLDHFIDLPCFMGAEDMDFINCAIIGAAPKNDFIKACLNFYESISYSSETELNSITIPRNVTTVFREKYNFKDSFNTNVNQDNVTIFCPEYFYPLKFEDRFDAANYRIYKKEISYSVHLWSNSWMKHDEFHYFRNGEYKLGFRQALRSSKTKNFKYFKKIISCIKQSFSTTNE